MKVEKIDHIHAYAKDLGAVSKLFTELFGMRCSTFTLEPGTLSCIAATKPGFIGFVQATDPECDVAKVIGDRPEGVMYISFKVPNIQEAIAEMEAHGIKLLKFFDLGPVKQAWFDPTNTFGIGIELGEYPGESIGGAVAESGILPPSHSRH